MIEIPNYTIERELGRGGMATVYLAMQDMLSRHVALKVMLPDMARDENFRKSFLSEGKIIANLEHPNVVRIHDVGVIDDSILYMAMEYLAGGTLKEKLTQGKLSYAEALATLEQTASGLEYAHSKGYIHRDVKPGNILFRDNGTCVITDFGIAKLQDTSGELTRMGYTMGTVQYMSPEQAITTDLDQRSDIYSLGLVFYEMLTGKKAFKAESTIQAIHQHTTVAPPELPAEYSFLQPTIDKVLAKEPDDRYQSANEFVEAVKNAANVDKTVIQKIPTSSDEEQTQIFEATGSIAHTQENRKSNKGLFAGIAGGAVLLGAVAFGVTKYPDFINSKNKGTVIENGFSQENKNVEEDKQKELASQEKIKTEQAKALVEQEKLKAEQLERDRVKQQEQERLMAEKLEADKEKLKQEEQDKLLAEQQEQERLMAEKLEADKERLKQEEQNKLLAEQKEQERLMAEKLKTDKERQKQEEQEKLLAEQKEQERLKTEEFEEEQERLKQKKQGELLAERKEKEKLKAEEARIAKNKQKKAEKKRKAKEAAAIAKKKAEKDRKRRALAKKKAEQARRQKAAQLEQRKKAAAIKALAKKKADAARARQQQSNQQGQIQVSVTLNGKPLNTKVTISKNGKHIRTITRAKSNNVLRPGRYLLTAYYGGESARATVNLGPRETAFQRFAFKQNAFSRPRAENTPPVQRRKSADPWEHEHRY